MATIAEGRSCSTGSAQRLYRQLARQLRPGWRAGEPAELAWCTPQLVDAVALPLDACGGAPAIDVWLADGAPRASIPRRQLVDGQTVAIMAHARISESPPQSA